MVDKTILGMFTLMMKPGVVLYIPAYLENVVNTQFMNLSRTGCFRFPPLVAHLFLYSHVENFTQLGLNFMDVNRNKQSVVFWTNIVRREVGNEGLYDFTSSFLPIVYSILNGSPAPCLLPKVQSFLKLSKDMKFWD